MSNGKCISCGKQYNDLPESNLCTCSGTVLLLCPCCGGDPISNSVFVDNTKSYYMYNITCSVCGLQTESETGYEVPENDEKNMGLAVNETYMKWNRRR